MATIIVLSILLSIPTTVSYTREDYLKEVEVVPAKPAIPVILQKISWCESRDRQFNPDGSVHRGEVNSQDVGKYQINEYYHLDTSRKLGYDIYTLEGNTSYALYLYKHQSSKPWKWSQHCWGGNETLSELKLKYK